MNDLGASQSAVLAYLKDRLGFVSPTVIGHDVGGMTRQGCLRNSSWASPICKRLVNRDLVRRDSRGWYQYIAKREFSLEGMEDN